MGAPYMAPMGYPPHGYYPYPPHSMAGMGMGKPGDPTPVYFSPYLIPIPPAPPNGNHPHAQDPQQSQPHQPQPPLPSIGVYPHPAHPAAQPMPAQFLPHAYPQAFGTYMVPHPHRSDGMIPMQVPMSPPSHQSQPMPPYGQPWPPRPPVNYFTTPLSAAPSETTEESREDDDEDRHTE